MDTYKYIEVKKSVFLKYKGQIVQLHSHHTKTEDVAQYSSEIASFLLFSCFVLVFHRHCTLSYTVKAGIKLQQQLFFFFSLPLWRVCSRCCKHYK